VHSEKSGPDWVSAGDVAKLLSVVEAVEAVEDALRAGLDPSADPDRMAVELGPDRGQLLLMPATLDHSLGVKIVTVAPEHRARTQPRISAVYAYFDGELQPSALIDGTVLTTLRTSAVSALAVRQLSRPTASRLVVFGSGPQAKAHIEAFRAVRPITRVSVVGRNPDTTGELLDWCRAGGLAAEAGTPGDVARADIVACCTTAVEPLFDGDLVHDGACVVAIGSHVPTARELDDGLLGRSLVVVEDAPTALREAGDVVQAVACGALDPADLVTLTQLSRLSPATDRPRVFKAVGMAWEDLVVAAAVVARYRDHSIARQRGPAPAPAATSGG